AYRIGANLVLTKPINVEQAKGTLRVARGLLRKNSDAAGGSATTGAGPTMPASAAPVSAGSSSPWVRRGEAEIAPPPSHPEPGEFETPLPAATQDAPAKIVSAPLSAQSISSAFTFPRSGAAPARAKEVTVPPARENKEDNKQVEWEPANPADDAAPPPSSVSATDSFSFSAVSEEADSGGLGGSKKILIAAAIVLAIAALYLSYGKPGKSGTGTPAPQPVSSLQDSAPPAPAPAPISSPTVAPSPGTPNRASSATQTSAPKKGAATLPNMPSPGAGNPPVIQIGLNPGLGTKKPDSTPLLVKANAGTKTQAQSQDSAPPLPSPLAVASANDSALNGLMSAAASTLPKPSLATTKISQGVSQGLLIKRVQPKYPQAALAMHAQGAVQIEATINKEGNVTNLKVLSGDPILAHAALEAVRQWRYKPYYLDGEPVEIQTQITVNFKAD
ncbi:MAG: TonB family protein, partial [Terriglobales bacterium]